MGWWDGRGNLGSVATLNSHYRGKLTTRRKFDRKDRNSLWADTSALPSPSPVCDAVRTLSEKAWQPGGGARVEPAVRDAGWREVRLAWGQWEGEAAGASLNVAAVRK